MNQAANPNVVKMFDRISPTYDFLNHFFSAGIDKHWRNKAIKLLNLKSGDKMLDCSAGTGDMSITAHQTVAGISTVLFDPARTMLAKADTKAENIPPQNYRLIQGAAEGIPFPDDSFDYFSVAFGIRNFANLEQGIRELHRTLKSNGKGVILEFTPDRSGKIDGVFRWYMQKVMPKVGGLISKDKEAYSYLSNTVHNFLTVSELELLYIKIGFKIVKIERLSFGIASLFLIEK